MKESELKEFRQILKYFPLVGISISQLATAIGINSSTLYNYRNGLIPKQDKYNAIMDKLKTDFPKEFEKVGLYMQIDREMAKGEWETI